MKPNEVEYTQEIVTAIKAHPLSRDNYENIIKDFEFVYREFLGQDFPLEVDQVSRLKSDLLNAFSLGIVAASDLNSHYRIGFRLPDELVFRKEPTKNQIIYPDKEIIDPTKKLIL